MKKREFLAVLASTAAACGLVACSSTADEPATTETEAPTQEDAFALDEWVQDNFTQAPYLVQNTTTNPQAWVPDNGEGLPLPDKATADDVVWQLPACVLVPYTGNGPTKSQVKDGLLKLSGWEHSEEGAAAAAVALFSMSVESENQPKAIAAATGISQQDAERLVATEKVFASRSSFTEDKDPQCNSNLNRMIAWNVVDYSDSHAVVDYFVPMEDATNGATLRMSVDWKDGDWHLSPASFNSYQQAIDNVQQSGGTGRAVDLEEFTQW